MRGSDRLWARDFRVSFTPLSEVLFTFPSRYWFAIGLSVVFSLAGWSPRIRPGFLVSRLTQVPPRPGGGVFAYGALTRSGPAFQPVPLTPARHFLGGPTTPRGASPRPRFGLGRFRSPLLAPSLFVFSSSGYLDVSVPRVRLPLRGDAGTTPGGLPHSDIRASKGICPSARLFAACRVLRRLREPRHPSRALLSFPYDVSSA